jgi:hypothetical protein
MHLEVLLTCVAGVALVLLYRRDAAIQKRQRGLFFAECLNLFQSYRVEQDGRAYPQLRGKYRDRTVTVEPIVDHLAWRKLPVLWVQVTVLQSTRYRGVLDFLARPTGAEYFSHAYNLAHHMHLPSDWPQEALLCCDDPESAVPLETLSPFLTELGDPKFKELVVTPNGVRLMWRVDQASRAHYASFREIKFETVSIDAELARHVLDTALAIADTVSLDEPQRKVA